MYARFCDACGKQLNRFDDTYSIRYDIRSNVSFKDSHGKIKGCGMTSLDFCPDCYAKIEAGIDSVVGRLPNVISTILKPERDRVIIGD